MCFVRSIHDPWKRRTVKTAAFKRDKEGFPKVISSFAVMNEFELGRQDFFNPPHVLTRTGIDITLPRSRPTTSTFVLIEPGVCG